MNCQKVVAVFGHMDGYSILFTFCLKKSLFIYYFLCTFVFVVVNIQTLTHFNIWSAILFLSGKTSKKNTQNQKLKKMFFYQNKKKKRSNKYRSKVLNESLYLNQCAAGAASSTITKKKTQFLFMRNKSNEIIHFK